MAITTNIFPPILNSTIKPQLVDNLNMINGIISIPFSVPSIVNYNNQIHHVQVRIVKQSDNKSIANMDLFPDGIIYIDSTTNSGSYIAHEDDKYTAIISTSYLAQPFPWKEGEIYKIQMRFGANVEGAGDLHSLNSWFNPNKNTDVSTFNRWRITYLDTFSEWSNVMLIKPIGVPTAYILNNEQQNTSNTIGSDLKIEPTYTPLFFARYEINSASKEAEDKYRFTLYEGDGVDLNETDSLVEDSGWLQHNIADDQADSHRFKTVLTEGTIYTVWYQIRTINGYEESGAYVFMPHVTYIDVLNGVDFYVDDTSRYCKENACCNISLKTSADTILSGNFVITRASEETNYTIWEDISYLLLENRTYPDGEVVYQDFLIESGIRYKYALQQENSAGVRTSPLYESHSLIDNAPTRSIDFEYSYLYADGIQLKLMFNNKLSSFKHTILESKQDTLGSKYVTISRNGYAHYAQFPINALVSLHMDIEDQTFFKRQPRGFYYKDELVIPSDKYEMDAYREMDTLGNTTFVPKDNVLFGTDQTHNTIFMERKFREKVMEFLDDGGYKVFKSPTEGNIIVGLMGVQFTPQEPTNRMIYNFSATAYEVMDYTLDNMNELGILSVGEFEEFDESSTQQRVGQVSGLFEGMYTLQQDASGKLVQVQNEKGSYTDFASEITKAVEVSAGSGYRYQLVSIDKIWVEPYAKNQSFDYEIAELKAQIAEKEINGEDATELNEKVEYYENFKKLSLLNEDSPLISLIINDTEVVVGRNKQYYLSDISGGVRTIYLKYTEPIILNYTCTVKLIEDEGQTVSGISDITIRGQISGIFTTTSDILKNYNYKYTDTPEFQAIENGDDSQIPTNFNVFRTRNIMEAIKADVKSRVEQVEGVFDKFNSAENEWYNSATNKYYHFVDLLGMSIETSLANGLIIKNYDTDGNISTEEKIVRIPVGERYRLRDIKMTIGSIELNTDSPDYIIVDYTAAVQLSTRKGSASNV